MRYIYLCLFSLVLFSCDESKDARKDFPFLKGIHTVDTYRVDKEGEVVASSEMTYELKQEKLDKKHFIYVYDNTFKDTLHFFAKRTAKVDFMGETFIKNDGVTVTIETNDFEVWEMKSEKATLWFSPKLGAIKHYQDPNHQWIFDVKGFEGLKDLVGF